MTSMSFEVGDRRFGDDTVVAEQLTPYLSGDPDVRRVAFAAPEDPVFLSNKTWFREVGLAATDTMQIEYAMIRAWKGDRNFAAGELRGVPERLRHRPEDAFWNRRRDATARLISCLKAGREVRPVIEALNAEGRALLRITRLRGCGRASGPS